MFFKDWIKSRDEASDATTTEGCQAGGIIGKVVVRRGEGNVWVNGDMPRTHVQERVLPEPTGSRRCVVCDRAREGGDISTGDIDRPVMRFVCNVCFGGMVCP